MEIENDIVEDDLEILEILDVGFPRQVYLRHQHFDNLSEMAFFKRFRLTKRTVVTLLNQIDHELEFPHNTNNAVSPINQLLMTLRFYATGNHLLSIGDFGGVHVSTACRVIKRVSEAIAALAPQYIKFPSNEQEINAVQRNFFEISRFPRVIGAIDGTHIRTQSPGGADAEVFRNRKNYFSINVQIVSDSRLRIMNVVSRWPGSAHDATIFNNSVLKLKFENAEYGNSLLLGDSGYPIPPYLLTPLLHPIGVAQQRYNESHIRTRNVVERCIGVWKRRFPVCAYGCRLKRDTVLRVIVATAVLHNLANRMGEEEPPLGEDQNQHILDHLLEEGNIPPILNNDNNAPEIVGYNIRNAFVNDYFDRLN